MSLEVRFQGGGSVICGTYRSVVTDVGLLDLGGREGGGGGRKELCMIHITELDLESKRLASVLRKIQPPKANPTIHGGNGHFNQR